RDGASETSTISYDDFSRVASVTDVDGTVTRNDYDAAGRLVRQVTAEGQTEADGAVARRASRVQYDAFGAVTGTLGGVGEAWLSSHPGQTVGDAIAQFGMRYEYDAAGRRIRAIDANDNITLFF